MTEEALRVPGIIHTKAMCLLVHDGQFLATRGFDEVKNEEFFRPIGGGVHFQERAVDAVRREVREEIGSDIRDARLLEVHENIFTFRGEPGHEIMFIFQAELADASLYGRAPFKILDGDSVAHWIPVAGILNGTLRVYPALDFHKYFS